ncbi:hypothetical protein DFP72DRAFT_857096 [Ephemerocybe angulata]|uniref:Uncharacterized protein n=1 Tax=Ephemerocybe angulata TaxID=980116 RepID=A0A8H6HD73_9AGAR|nr:hypothetical protein DFP72DRAFT_857096 [Tulosesus angulatus]
MCMASSGSLAGWYNEKGETYRCEKEKKWGYEIRCLDLNGKQAAHEIENDGGPITLSMEDSSKIAATYRSDLMLDTHSSSDCHLLEPFQDPGTISSTDEGNEQSMWERQKLRNTYTLTPPRLRHYAARPKQVSGVEYDSEQHVKKNNDVRPRGREHGEVSELGPPLKETKTYILESSKMERSASWMYSSGGRTTYGLGSRSTERSASGITRRQNDQKSQCALQGGQPRTNWMELISLGHD